MDLTWTFYEKGKKVMVNQGTFCYASEPTSFTLWRKQLTRWNIGYFEVVSLHMPHLKKMPVLREFVFMAIADAMVGTAILIRESAYLASNISFNPAVLTLYIKWCKVHMCQNSPMLSDQS